VGAGSYHWVVADGRGGRCFVTLDDLDTKPWLGDTRDEAFAGLQRAFDVTLRLRECGLEFVCAPTRSLGAESVCRMDDRYAIALYPFVEGEAGEFGKYLPGDREAVLAMLARLHGATRAVESSVARMVLDVPGRQGLEAALGELDRPWTAGPYGEPARELLARYASAIAELLATVDHLAGRLSRSGWVVTHGEPHAGNLIRTSAGHTLIDWDTVALGPRERDLWMLADSGELAEYTRAAGYAVDPTAVRHFRLRWLLADVVAFTHELRSPHNRTEDAELAIDILERCLASIRESSRRAEPDYQA
jgi:spectinomycin phosphotransferase